MAFKRIDTKLIHAGQPRIAGAVEMPIFQSAMWIDPPGWAGAMLRAPSLPTILSA